MTTIWTLVVVPAALLIVGFPVFAALLVAGILTLVLASSVPLAAVHQVMFGSIDSFALISIPFFIFAGELMSRGGISRRIIVWVITLFRGRQAVLPLTAVATCTVYGAVSGSSPATVAAVGKLLFPAMRSAGYSAYHAGGLLTSAGAIAIIIPPSLSMILYGAVAEQSISDLFIAGIGPGLLLSAFMALYVVLAEKRARVGAPRPQAAVPAAAGAVKDGAAGGEVTIGLGAKSLATATREGILAIGTPLIILGGIYGGVFSPTEAAGAACVYALLLTLVIYRELDLRSVLEIAADAAVLSSQILIIVAAAGVFSWLLTINGVAQAVQTALAPVAQNPVLFLLAVNVTLLVVGCFIDTSSAILILTPLIMPLANIAGIDPIHLGVIVSLNLAIGMFTPPFGLNIFVAQSVLKLDIGTIYRGIWPFLLVNLVVLLIVTFVPAISLFLLS
ncbi:TRAP transporter large permease [Propylenella binzhouense]|uniref:TRAP transporter large permease protein n=1 Tax=Propylenella binzhouense TaxID=2555902 RepID=A0A964T228_9HYPH|nr:TRAP transporter large permease subunit [Propylenella binzhouense]MYZ46532.1 TRAP transporter large permease subunit [Propylenella binzhouense]